MRWANHWPGRWRHLASSWGSSRPGSSKRSSRQSGDAGAAIRAQSPLNRVAFPEEIAKVVLFLASEGSEFTTGTIIDVNGASYLRS